MTMKLLNICRLCKRFLCLFFIIAVFRIFNIIYILSIIIIKMSSFFQDQMTLIAEDFQDLLVRLIKVRQEMCCG